MAFSQSISSGSMGNTSAGAVTHLVATGAINAYLNENAQFTYFKMRYQRHTHFACESVIQPFNTSVAFGATAQMTLNRTGDMIHQMYCLIELPGITATPSEQQAGMATHDKFPHVDRPTKEADAAIFAQMIGDNDLPSTPKSEHMAEALLKGKQRWQKEKYGCCALPEACNNMGDEHEQFTMMNADGEPSAWASWSNAIGQLLVKTCSIVIGGSTVDTLYNDFLFMWEELTGKSGKRLTEMIGKRYTRTQLVCDSRGARVLYVPLPFWFTQHSGQSLSLASLQFHGVQIQVEFERLENCIITSGPDVTVRNCSSGGPIINTDIAAAIETTYVYLDSTERQKFATSSFEQLIVQLQQYHVTSSNSQVRMQLNFNHPIIELIFAVRRQANEKANNWFDYSGIDNRDPIVKASLFLNNQPRFNNKSGTWLRMVQPYQSHTNIPDCFIYNYSFALHPEHPEPSGSCNFSRIDHVDLVINLQEGLGKEQVTVLVYARNWNVLRFKEGLAGVAYTN